MYSRHFYEHLKKEKEITRASLPSLKLGLKGKRRYKNRVEEGKDSVVGELIAKHRKKNGAVTQSGEQSINI